MPPPWPLIPGQLVMFLDPYPLLCPGVPGVLCRNGYTRVPGAGCGVGSQRPRRPGSGVPALGIPGFAKSLLGSRKDLPEPQPSCRLTCRSPPHRASRIPWPYLPMAPQSAAHVSLPTAQCNRGQGLPSEVSSVQEEQQGRSLSRLPKCRSQPETSNYRPSCSFGLWDALVTHQSAPAQ